MADYWKSNPRKFCDFCQCWFADNKSSIEFHERGKRHQENVAKKIAELRKKGQKQHETQQELSGFLKQMEEGAMKAFKKDVAQNPNLVPEYKVALVQKKVREAQDVPSALPGSRTQPAADGVASEQAATSAAATAATSSTASSSMGQSQAEWVEAVSPDGHTYYWNTVTGESQWEKPENFTPVTGGSTTENEAPAHKGGKDDGDKNEKSVEGQESKGKSEESSRATKRRHDAYGGWSTVSNETEETPDLQLPEANPAYMSSYVPQAAQYEPREKLAFKEKTVGSIGTSNDNVAFKKRKAGGRQIRSRDTTS
ncbi:WW domain-binding protein 4-like [Diadema antillarum]|uniref:WW domain-binding protein 4-like n=1 Tax=Diadema antillarum TaxID=105358 RepID=UPI003A841565